MLGTMMGVLLIGVINNGLTLNNVQPFWVQFIQGAVIFGSRAVRLHQPEASRRLSSPPGFSSGSRPKDMQQ